MIEYFPKGSKFFKCVSNGTFRVQTDFKPEHTQPLHPDQQIRDDKSLDCHQTYTDTSLVFNSRHHGCLP